MKKAISIILLTLFSLGTFGVTIEQHLCCHSSAQENTETNHCNDDESCCDENADCCDEIVSQVKIAKDFTVQDSKITLELNDIALLSEVPFLHLNAGCKKAKNTSYNDLCYYPPPEDFQISYCSFLI